MEDVYGILPNKCLKKVETVGRPGTGENSACFNDPTNVASGESSTAFGKGNTSAGRYSVAFGENNNIDSAAQCGVAFGRGNSITYSHGFAIGENNTADGKHSLVVGEGNEVGSANTIIAGTNCNIGNNSAFGWGAAFGQNLIEGIGNAVYIGRFNKILSASERVLVIGGGTTSSALKNVFRITPTGAVYGTGAYNSSGADYAEMFEWVDGNETGADRRGLFVTLQDDKIRLATADDDYILGVVSTNPAIVGDSYFGDVWHDMYKRDVFGTVLLNEEGNPILNPDFDPSKEYVSRDKRPEWSAIGMLGKLIVVDDGTCAVNGYCTVGTGGIGTAGEKGYRVMKRLDENHVMILFRHV